jgi:hypothetical protein
MRVFSSLGSVNLSENEMNLYDSCALHIDHFKTMLIVNPAILYGRPLRSKDADSVTPEKQAARFTGQACGGKYNNRFAIIPALMPEGHDAFAWAKSVLA